MSNYFVENLGSIQFCRFFQHANPQLTGKKRENVCNSLNLSLSGEVFKITVSNTFNDKLTL
jgi:hypothetical protein